MRCTYIQAYTHTQIEIKNIFINFWSKWNQRDNQILWTPGRHSHISHETGCGEKLILNTRFNLQYTEYIGTQKCVNDTSGIGLAQSGLGNLTEKSAYYGEIAHSFQQKITKEEKGVRREGMSPDLCEKPINQPINLNAKSLSGPNHANCHHHHQQNNIRNRKWH